MIDDPKALEKRIAYIDKLRGLHRAERMAGFLIILLGVLLILGPLFYAGWPHWLITVGWVMTGIGWALFIYVIWRRTAWRKANPFDRWEP